MSMSFSISLSDDLGMRVLKCVDEKTPENHKPQRSAVISDLLEKGLKVDEQAQAQKEAS